MVHRYVKKVKNSAGGPLLAVFVLLAVLLATWYFLPRFGADTNTNPLKNSRLSAEVKNLYGESIATEYPDGKSYIEVILTASNKDGSPLINVPITISKSSSINVQGPSNTGNGQIQLKFTAGRAVSDKVTIRLRDASTAKASFKIKFASDYSMTDLTDKNDFIIGVPLTLRLGIKPWMTDHLGTVKAKYTYTRRVNKWGVWFSTKRVATITMKCTDGICQANFGSDYTSKDRNRNGTFVYGFTITDLHGKNFSKSFRGKLRNP